MNLAATVVAHMSRQGGLMMHRDKLFGVGTALAVLIAGAVALPLASPVGADESNGSGSSAKHVLLISVDGLHQSDVNWYVTHHPDSTLASLVENGADFTHASTTVPSDSFPGMVAQVTGGSPATTGVYYDDSYNHRLLPAGTTNCSTATPGVEVTYFEQLDINNHALDAGQGLLGLPGSILNLTGKPTTLIDPTQLPVDPTSCEPVYPHSYLRVNTVFEVARQAGLRTAWSGQASRLRHPERPVR
jgi:hypothetical protein